MRDIAFFGLLGLASAGLIGLALVWPQGLGARSPEPFGSPPVQQQPRFQAALKRDTEAAQRRARETIGELQSQAVEAAK